MSNTACAGIIVCFYCFDLPQFRGERMGATACLLWLFGAAGIGCTYLFSFAFMVSTSFANERHPAIMPCSFPPWQGHQMEYS